TGGVIKGVKRGIPKCRIKCRLIKHRKLIIALVRPWQIGVAYAQVESEAIVQLEVVVEISFEVFPAALLFENDVLFSPLDSHILQDVIRRAVMSSKVRLVGAASLGCSCAAVVSDWAIRVPLHLREIVLIFRVAGVTGAFF